MPTILPRFNARPDLTGRSAAGDMTARGIPTRNRRRGRRARQQFDGAMSRVAGDAGSLRGISADMYRTFQGVALPAYQRMGAMAGIPMGDYVNEAAADVGRSFNAARGMMTRNLTRMGVNPNSGRWADQERNWALAEAAARAGAMTGARRRGRIEQFGRLQNVAAMGMGLPGQAAGNISRAATLDDAVAGLADRAGTEAGLADANEQGGGEWDWLNGLLG